MSIDNDPISYDFHGDTPFEVPFSQIAPQDIHIYLDLDTRVGKETCGQSCDHCWFVNYEKVHDKSFDPAEGLLVQAAIERAGYKVYPRFVDSFAYKGSFMRTYGPAHNREFRQELDHKPTKTMLKGDAWTSGKPLYGDDYEELLDVARDSGYGTISITFHGLIDRDLQVMDGRHYPIKGVFGGAKTAEVVRRIFAYNAHRRAEGGSPDDDFRVNIGLTLGRHNNSRESLERYVHYFNALGVSTLRFNNYLDHSGRHPELQMDPPELEQAYRDIKWLHDTFALKFQLAVSEDFGTFGIKVMGFPSHVGWCRAGRQLFTVIPAAQTLLRAVDDQRHEKIGDVVACVNVFEPHLGILVRKTNLRDHSVDYALEFDHQAIDEFTAKRMTGVYKNGCFAPELVAESRPKLIRLVRRARKAAESSEQQP